MIGLVVNYNNKSTLIVLSMSTPKPLLFPYFNDTAQVLLAEFQRSSQQAASANLGRNREFFCSQFLDKVLPPKLSVKSGEIWDSSGNKTGQLYVIITRDDCPCLHIGSDDIYLAEGVFAVIEVKSDLTTAKLDEAAQSLRLVQNLSNSGGSNVVMSCGPVLNRPLRIVVSYKGATWETLLARIENARLADVFDLICILERGTAMKNGLLLSNTTPPPPSNPATPPTPMQRYAAMQEILHPRLRPAFTPDFLVAKGKAASLGFLYYHLLAFASSFMVVGFSLNDYFKPLNSWDET